MAGHNHRRGEFAQGRHGWPNDWLEKRSGKVESANDSSDPGRSREFLGPANEQMPAMEHGNVAAIGKVLYSRYLFPFEITSILLLVAMVGVIVIARGRAKHPEEGA